MNELAPSDKAAVTPREGFIVVAVLWLLAGLAALAVIASLYVAQSAVTLTALDAATQQEMLATAGVELTAYELLVPSTTGRRPTHGSFSFALAGSTVQVRYVSEAARLNINLASREAVAALFTALGAQSAAGQYADRVIAWRSKPEAGVQDEEVKLYRAAGLSYEPRRASFNSIDELWQVLGLPASLVRRAILYTTVYSTTADINILDAAPEVLATLPDLSSERIESFVKDRDALPQDDPQAILNALGGKLAGASLLGGDVYRAYLRVIPPRGLPTRLEAVIKLPGPEDRGAYKVLFWRSETGG